MTAHYLLAAEGDNVAIVPRRLEKGTEVDIAGAMVRLPQTILQGHRICVSEIRPGADLLSWGLPFGTATGTIRPGDYICNDKAREVLLARNPNDYDEGLRANFENRDTVAERILPDRPEYGTNIADLEDGLTFEGYDRGEPRGWGTRNYVAIIGVSSRVRGTVLAAAARLKASHPARDGFDGVVPVVHTEGGGNDAPNNRELLVRTLAGFAINPNVGAAILVGDARSVIGFDEIEAEFERRGVPAAERAVRFVTLDPRTGVETLARMAAEDAERVPAPRASAPVSALRLGLQCGGSDAFSGVSANQVLGRMAHALIRRGGTANLAETDELIGAEQYVLQRTADPQTYEAFLATQQRFKDYAAVHGQTAEGNVSGGNLYRGLYNITLKSIGAARKKDPRTFIDAVIDYGEPMREPGYYFMNSPGNDLESIAGQVASGANVVLFTTGNGSITNFPFVPTLKIVTTSERYRLLESDMDFDAGKVLSGESFEASAERLFDLVRTTASGTPSKGERTGQYQTQIWRDAYFPTRAEVEEAGPGNPSPQPLIPAGALDPDLDRITRLPAVDLILPTSLCSGQVAELIAADLNGKQDLRTAREVVALAHTEGCGVSGGQSETIFRNTLIGYATHPLVSRCVFLEHGCEKTHNDYFQGALRENGLAPDHFEWASIQNEGGIRAVTDHVEAALTGSERWGTEQAQNAPLLVGIASTATDVTRETAAGLGTLAARLLSVGIGVVGASNDILVGMDAFRRAAGLEALLPGANLDYAQRAGSAGFHVMDCSSSDWLEVATGLGATGCRTLVVHTPDAPSQPHRFIPTVQVGRAEMPGPFDLAPDLEGVEGVEALVSMILASLSGEYRPVNAPAPNVGFQISRGRFGVSL